MIVMIKKHKLVVLSYVKKNNIKFVFFFFFLMNDETAMRGGFEQGD